MRTDITYVHTTGGARYSSFDLIGVRVKVASDWLRIGVQGLAPGSPVSEANYIKFEWFVPETRLCSIRLVHTTTAILRQPFSGISGEQASNSRGTRDQPYVLLPVVPTN